jgi:hypothetical protein
VSVRDAVKVNLPDAVVVVSGFLFAKWWGLAFGLGCVLVARFGTRALMLNALCVLVVMVLAVLLEGQLKLSFDFSSSRPIANELGLLLLIAVLALVIPRPNQGK